MALVFPPRPASAGHPHAVQMLEYAQDAAVTPTPWFLWECAETKSGAPWRMLEDHPTWTIRHIYRRKPKTIRIGAFDVPEPMRVVPAVDAQYFVVDLTQGNGAILLYWGGHPQDLRCLGGGIAHGTREAAELHARALLSFTTQTETVAHFSV